MASKKSQLKKRRQLWGAKKRLLNTMQSETTFFGRAQKLVEQHSACYSQWEKTQSRHDEAQKDIQNQKRSAGCVFAAGFGGKTAAVGTNSKHRPFRGSKSMSLDVFKDMITVQLKNAADVGCQYYSQHHAKDMLHIMFELERATFWRQNFCNC
jgi:hypothetical protein